jgi:hypothetical protein
MLVRRMVELMSDTINKTKGDCFEGHSFFKIVVKLVYDEKEYRFVMNDQF